VRRPKSATTIVASFPPYTPGAFFAATTATPTCPQLPKRTRACWGLASHVCTIFAAVAVAGDQ